MTMKSFPALALAGALLVGGCTNPDGSLNAGNTALMLGGAALLGAAALSPDNHSDHRRHEVQERRDYHREQEQEYRQERRNQEREYRQERRQERRHYREDD